MTDSPAPEAPAEPPKSANDAAPPPPIPSSSPETHLSPPTPSPTASYVSSAAVTPSVGYDSSAPPTPGFDFPANSGYGNPALALDTPARELGNLSLAGTPESHSARGGSPHLVQGVGADAEKLSAHPDAKDHHAKLAESVLARTSAGQQALKEGALPSAKGLAIPGPSTPAAGTGPGTPNFASSTAATPGNSRVGTPQIGGPEQPQPREKEKSAMPPSAPSSGAAAASTASYGRRPGMDGKTDGVPVKEGKKSVFGKLFDRDRNSSTTSFASSAQGGGGSSAMERRGSGSGGVGAAGASEPNVGAHLNGLAAGAGGASGASSPNLGGTSTPPLLGRRKSESGQGGKRDKEQEKADKEREKREKQERKEREKREKEEAKEAAGRARSASRGRTPSQTGRPRSDSKGAENAHHHAPPPEKKGALDGAMDFMRIKVQRKSSVTSRRSDDGRSEKSVHLGGGDEGGGGRSQYGGSEGAKSKGGASNASLSKKYGVCDKVIVGKGATAVVRLAHKWDRSTEKLYAVKEFRKRRKNETEKEYVKKLTSEFCISSTLHHHNVVETVDLVQDEQQHWCEVMEYCPGGDLYAVIKKGDLGPAEINSYFAQILSGVAYLHSMGVAHRDIKPENLLLDAKGHVKITDFGVSDVFRMCWEKTTHLSKGLCGSEPYIAPEQFEHKEYDARLVDVWACAVVYYCMQFQELPWRVAKHSDPSFGPYAQAYKTSSSTPPPLSNLVPRECRSVIRKMLDPDPKTRATTEEVINSAWFQTIEVIPPISEGLLQPKLGPA